MFRRTIPLWAFLVLFSSPIYAQPLHVARERTYDVLHYKLMLSIDEKARMVAGDAAITLVPLRPALHEVVLDAGELRIEKVVLGRESLQFSTSGEQLRIALRRPARFTDTLTIVVRYAASPRKGLYFVQPDSSYPDRPWQVWSQGQAEDNHFWFPCYDYPNDFATSEMIVTVDERFTAISNGTLLKTTHDKKEKKKTYHWRESKPHVSYLISLVVGEYVELRDSWDGIPLVYYVYPHHKDIARYSFSKTPFMVKYFSESIGYRYPWEKYAQTIVADFIYGGMENVSASTLTDFTIHDERAHLDVSSDGLVAHELAHQWWGDLVTCRDWSHAWLNEGFATYYTFAFYEADSGFHHAAYSLLGTQENLVKSDTGSARRPTVTARFFDASDIFDNRIYGKGACILHMLRFVLGDELFRKAIKHYVTKHAFQNTETNDFKIAIEEATGYNLHWFFKQWVYQAGYPEFVVTRYWDSTTQNLRMTVRQEQHFPEYTREDTTGDVFVTPIDLEIWSGGRPRTERITVSKRMEEFTFRQPQRPQCVVFDKGNWILKNVAHQKNAQEWMFQAEKCEGIERVLAVKELRRYSDRSDVISVLRRRLLNDPFWPVRVEAAKALGEVHDSLAALALIKAYQDGHARVREAVISSLSSFPKSIVYETLYRAFASDRSYGVASAAMKSLVKVDSGNAWRHCRDALQRTSHLDVLPIAALAAITDIGDEEAFEVVKSYTRSGLRRNVRVAAVQSLARGWAGQERAADVLIGLLDDQSLHVRRAVIEALGTMKGGQVVRSLQRRVVEEPDSRLRKAARDAIEKIQQTSHVPSH